MRVRVRVRIVGMVLAIPLTAVLRIYLESLLPYLTLPYLTLP